jgi:serine/threonine-protein kinase RsbW
MVSRHSVASPDSVREARCFASEYIADLSPELQDTVSIMVSELSTNALVHGCVGFDVTIDRSLTLLRVAVTDQGDGTPVVRTPGEHEPHGRGLRIVEALSDHWGITDPSGHGKTVWFQLGLTSGPDDVVNGSDAGSAGSQRVASVAASRAASLSTPMAASLSTPMAAPLSTPMAAPLSTPMDTPPHDSPDASSATHRRPGGRGRPRGWPRLPLPLPTRLPLPLQSRCQGAARP